MPALPAGVAAEQRLGLKVGDSSFSWPLKQCDANAALEGSSRGRGLARCAVFPCVPREKMKNTKKSGWNTLARHAENIAFHTILGETLVRAGGAARRDDAEERVDDATERRAHTRETAAREGLCSKRTWGSPRWQMVTE